MAFLHCVRSDSSKDPFYGENINHTDHTHKASHCSVLSDESHESFYKQSIDQTVHI